MVHRPSYDYLILVSIPANCTEFSPPGKHRELDIQSQSQHIACRLRDSTEQDGGNVKQLLQVLLDRADALQPFTLVTDFELGTINAFILKFPGIKCTGCFFHLTQNIYRQVQSNGLQLRYAQDSQFAVALRMLPALAIVPTGDVATYFEAVEDNFPHDATAIITYFKHSNIGTSAQNGQRRTPLFPIALWNVHDRTLIGEDRTNNAQKGWHCRFASMVTCHHPTIWKVI